MSVETDSWKSGVKKQFLKLIDSEEKCETLVDAIESQVDDWAIENGILRTDFEYRIELRNKCVSLYDNLNPGSYIGNKSLLGRVLSDEIKVESLPKMTPQELFPEHWEALMKRKEAEAAITQSKRFVAISHEFRCRKCGKNETSYKQLQTRSSDEPMTTFITCLFCGNHWKVN